MRSPKAIGSIYLLIESTGISEPLPVAATFDFRNEEGDSLSDVAVLDTMVTVVDAVNLLRDYSSTDFLKDRGESRGADDTRTMVDLLVEQIEFAPHQPDGHHHSQRREEARGEDEEQPVVRSGHAEAREAVCADRAETHRRDRADQAD